MNRNAQVSVEFIIVILLLLSLFLFSLGVFGEKNNGYIHLREQYEARLVADKLARTINYVHAAGPGAEASIFLEERLKADITISGNAAAVEWRDNYVDSALLTDNVTVNSISQGSWLTVKNVNGGIEIEEA